MECAIGRWKGRFRCLDKSGGFLQYDPDVICKMINVCAVLHNFLLELKDGGDGEAAAADVDPPPEGPHGTQPQDGQPQAEFEDEKRRGKERRAVIMARFIQARRSLGLPLELPPIQP